LIKLSNSPKTWINTPLETLITYVLGGDWGKAPESRIEGYSKVFCIRGTEFRHWSLNKGCSASLRLVKEASLKSRKLKENDILVEISGGGPEQPVGRTVLIDKACLAINPNTPKVGTNFLRLMRPSTIINAKYLNFFLNCFYSSGEIVKYQAGSNNLRNLKFNNYLGIDIPLAPVNEQNRIVEKIEELFSELDKGIESLKTAKAQLVVYRKALLKHAFEGKLTEQWRKENADDILSPNQQLTHIQQEREERYQQQLDNWQADIEKWEIDGKEVKKPNKPKKLKALSTDESYINSSIGLPLGWIYCSLGQLVDEPTYGTSKKCSYEKEGKGVLRIPNVAHNIIDSSDLKYADFEDHEIKSYQLHEGDIVIIRSNGSVSLVGKGALIDQKDTHLLFAGYLIRLRANPKIFYPKYFLYILQSHALRQQIEGKAKSTSGVNNINTGELQSLVISLPNIVEQKMVISLLESNLSLCDNTMQDIEKNLRVSEVLRQSILEKAFSGQLVSSDDSDEPASELLRKIEIEKVELAAIEKIVKAATKKSKAEANKAKA